MFVIIHIVVCCKVIVGITSSFFFSANGWIEEIQRGDIPAARSNHTLSAASNNVVLFGGNSYRATKLNDLWSYDTSKVFFF